jgi:hypothetical protein
MAGILDMLRGNIQRYEQRQDERAIRRVVESQTQLAGRLAEAEQQRAAQQAAQQAPGLAAALGRLVPQQANPNVGAGMNPADPRAQAVGLLMDPRTRQLGAAQAGALLDPLGRQQLANAGLQGQAYEMQAARDAQAIEDARRMGPLNEQAARALVAQRTAAAQASAASAAAAAAGRIDPIEARINQRWLAQMEAPVQVLDAVQQAEAALDTGDSLGSLAAVIKLAKVLDPTSVVREGEVTTVQGGTGVAESLIADYNRIFGKGFSPQGAAAFRRTLRATAKPILQRGVRITDEITQQALAYGAVPARVTTGIGWSDPYVRAYLAD